MTKLYNQTSDREKRKQLRNNMTEAEKVLWEAIRKKRLVGYKFRRQYSIKGFIMDFYLPRLKLAVEIDGGYHLNESVSAYDKERQKLLESLGVKFIRFSNDQILYSKMKIIDILSEKMKLLEKCGDY